jgi:HK97 family phage major capsid protein
VLTNNASSDPSGSTNLDSLELAINALRVQSGVFSVPDLCIMSPTTWSHTRRIKDTTGRFIAGDPLQSAVHSVWGVPVLVTTSVNDGDAFLVDSSKVGSVLIREGLSMHMGYIGYGLVENILTIVEEERFALATVIPSAVQYITNLAVG